MEAVLYTYLRAVVKKTRYFYGKGWPPPPPYGQLFMIFFGLRLTFDYDYM